MSVFFQKIQKYAKYFVAYSKWCIGIGFSELCINFTLICSTATYNSNKSNAVRPTEIYNVTWLIYNCISDNQTKPRNARYKLLMVHTFFPIFNPLSANPSKWPNTLKQFIVCRQIVRVCLTILWNWRLKG